jgi:glutaredoxin 3
MATQKRTVEVFSAGCPCCDEAVKLVQRIACPSCDVQIHDMRNDPAAQKKAQQYGIKSVPAVVVDGNLADCCKTGGVDEATLRKLGIGQPRP